MKAKLLLASVSLGALIAAPGRADVKPHNLFTDNAVLQRGMPVPVWGWADPGEKVTVSIAGRSARTEAGSDGKWRVKLPELKAGGPYTLTMSGKNRVEAKNILVGEVWIASGQSNMQWPLFNTVGGEDFVKDSTDPQYRLLYIPRHTAETPEDNITAPWQESNPASAREFSAVAYHFGKELRKRLKVPVGVIHTSWGGTIAEAWTRQEVLERTPNLDGVWQNQWNARKNYFSALAVRGQVLERYREAAARARAAGQQPPAAPQALRGPNDASNPNRPSVLYNAMIAPLIPYAIKGAIWYQGESNAGRAWEYQTLFAAMIQNWRSDWSQGDFPFYLVQLAPYMAIQSDPQEAAWPELREAQRLTTLRLPKVGQAVITDLGEERDIHPRKKQEVGQRLAYLALHNDYGLEDVTPLGPTPAGVKFRDGKAIVSFDNVAGGLEARGGALKGFTLAGEDRKFYNATATIDGDRVIVSSPQVSRPVAVRYGWWSFPVVNFYNKAGLPATPFRTDDFPLTTGPK